MEEDGEVDVDKDVDTETVCCGAFEADETEEEFGCVVGPLLLSLLIVVCGTMSTVATKLMYGIRSEGTDSCLLHPDGDDEERTKNCFFTKPWYQTLIMKMAMSCCLLFSVVAKRLKRGRQKDVGDGTLQESLMSDAESNNILKNPPPQPSWASIRYIAWPALTDLLQTVLAQAGLLWVSSSTYQMTRGSVIVFTCYISVKFFGKRLWKVHYLAIGVVCLAIVIVGLAGLLGEEEDATDGSTAAYILGLVLILLAQVVGAIQFVLEESIMEKHHVSPTVLVGWEGAWGCLMFCFLAPVLSMTPGPRGSGTLADATTIWHEDFRDTFVQLSNSPELVAYSISVSVVLLVYNLVGNMVTKQLSAVMRSILETVRTLGVWFVSLLLWYLASDHDAGEKWTNFSFIELAGFVLLVYGTLAYKEILPMPFVKPAKKGPTLQSEVEDTLI